MNFEAFLGAAAERELRAGASDRDIENMISEIMGIFKDPVILYPGGWESTLPKRLWDEITLQRFVQQFKAKGKKIEEATDAEAMAYLYSASLVAPMGTQWTNIYLWLGRGFGVPDPSRGTPEKLSSDEERALEDLKRWIWRQKTKGRSKKTYPVQTLELHLPKRKSRRKAAVGCMVSMEAAYGIDD